ncbi:MAG: carboxypeptidase regulatory-like domain-containing protein [Terriglobales bacterium]
MSSAATINGHVRDSSRQPVANATVFLQLAAGTPSPATPQRTQTDSEGAYSFAGLRNGTYTLRAQGNGYSDAIVGPVLLAPKETKKIDFTLVSAKDSPAQSAPTAKPAAAKPGAPQFFDEPQFTVAGVTQATNSGGHGSDTVLRATEALAKATVSLSQDTEAAPEPPSAATEKSLRDTVIRNPTDPQLHHRLADVEEKLGNPLEAVREYQRAAELDPSELNLFDWGTELLTHRALDPAAAVFAKGNRLYPKSMRMLLALGVASYARGANQQAAQYLASASDLDPGNPTPYLFLGKIQSVETTPPEGTLEKLARFAQLQPENALANYYYAVSLSKEIPKESAKESAKESGKEPGKPSEGAADSEPDAQRAAERSQRIESLLQKAVRLDPKLAAPYLQLGILYAQRSDFPRAISAYQQAIAASPEDAGQQPDETLAEAHYRLAQAYRRTGEKAKAQEQLQLHDRLVKESKETIARERREIQEFVISLHDNNSPPQ